MHATLTMSLIFALGQPSAADDSFFEAKIRPVLIESCFKCHGGEKVSHKLRVDSRDALVKGGKSGPALVPGKPEKSLLLQAIKQSSEDLRMPPGGKLPAHVIADFTAWIERGAVWPKSSKRGFQARTHWAFQPMKNVAPPADPTRWAEHPIDRYIAANLREQGLKPARAAEPRSLLRRVTFDLTGLPPTVEESATPQAAWETVVDRLLASPRYGERWARHWMDVVRYADTAGDNADYPIPEIVRYRDYLIDAFNADKPFNDLVREQLAGDILAKSGPPQKYAERVVATGFLALSRRYATAPYEFMHLTLEDTIDTTGAAFIGLTLRCARCHDHKFDPITTEDYYGLYGIFASTTFPFAGSEEFASQKRPREHFVPLVPNSDKVMADYRERLKDLPALIKAEKDKGKVNALQTEERVLHRLGLPIEVPGAYAVQDGKVADVRIHLKGDPDKLGELAPRRVPKFIEGKPVAFSKTASGRLELADWLTRPDHPLTARVLVNRVWQYHFGTGLVATPNNFGTRGELPSHPELLDHLALEFVKQGWSIKWLHRYILSSKTYQLLASPSADLASKDPSNRWLSHFPRRRLDAEALRDAMLSVSGKLDLKRPGPHPFPPIQNWGWTQHNPFKDIYPSNHRSVYLMTQRIQRHPFLALFDGPDTNASTEKRTTSLVPLQALYLMNHSFVREQAEAFAKRTLAVAAEGRIAWAHQTAWGRPASKAETQKGVEYLRRYQEELKRSGEAPERLELSAWTSFARVLLTANEFVFVD
ncbi:MAG: DUF1553 domain-containing protein [Gemmataceae bacterium]|nr:DUF1553 domain-containing protein [Gemmataceae bacterium]